MSFDVNGTLLVITPLSGSGALLLTPYSARNLTQTLEPISPGGNAFGSWIRESTNGELMDVSAPWAKKYQSTITCTDIETPCLDDAWRGMIVEVDCACELNYLTATGSPHRPVVSGSSRENGDFTFYRPQLTMMVLDINNSFAEWRADRQWQVTLREAFPPT